MSDVISFRTLKERKKEALRKKAIARILERVPLAPRVTSLSPTQEEYMANIYRVIKKIHNELVVCSADSNMLDLINHLDNSVELLHFSLDGTLRK